MGKRNFLKKVRLMHYKAHLIAAPDTPPGPFPPFPLALNTCEDWAEATPSLDFALLAAATAAMVALCNEVSQGSKICEVLPAGQHWDSHSMLLLLREQLNEGILELKFSLVLQCEGTSLACSKHHVPKVEVIDGTYAEPFVSLLKEKAQRMWMDGCIHCAHNLNMDP